MSGLAALLAGHNAPDVYQWHSAAHVPDVEHAVDHADWRFVHLDGWTIEDRQSFLKAASVAFTFPDDLGESCERLAECLHDVDCGSKRGVVLLWDGWSPLARHDQQTFEEILSVLGERARSEQGCKLAVLLRGDGPPLDLPELPVKH